MNEGTDLDKTKIKLATSLIGGLSVICLYCACTLLSYLFWPTSLEFSPATRWLSELGNYTKNTFVGATFYNLGCMFTGVALFPFFLGLYMFYSKAKWKSLLVILGQAVGFFDAISLFFIGIYSDPMPLHMYWSEMFFKTNLFVLIIVSVALIFSEKYMKWISIYGFGVAAFNLLEVYVFPSSTLLEWFTVFTALGFVGLIELNIFLKFGREPVAK